MDTLRVKGYEFLAFSMKGASSRKAIQLRNTIVKNLKRLGVNEDDIEIPLEMVVIKKAPSSASWYLDGHHLYFSYKKSRFIENLHVVSKIIELEVASLLNEEKTVKEFIADFSEDRDVESKRKKARALLGVSEDTLDLDEIDKKYKLLAKEHHPDKGGSAAAFKEINDAHKILKRELH